MKFFFSNITSSFSKVDRPILESFYEDPNIRRHVSRKKIVSFVGSEKNLIHTYNTIRNISYIQIVSE